MIVAGTASMGFLRVCSYCGEPECSAPCRQCSCCSEPTGNNDYDLCDSCCSAEESRAARVECEVCGRTYDSRKRTHHHSMPVEDR